MTFREAEILPIQIRPDLIIRVHGIPHDLTPEEAAKIARVIMAHAIEVETRAHEAEGA